MAITSNQVTVTTTAQTIVNVDDVTQNVYLHSKGATYVGGAGVTSTSGYLVDNGDKLTLTVPVGSVLQAVTNAATHDLYVLITRVD